jgi:hypothetical protein
VKRLALVLLLLSALLAAVVPGAAIADEGEEVPPEPVPGEIEAYTVTTSTTQAGGHPDISLELNFPEGGFLEGIHDPRQIATHMPAGLIGNPHAIPTCSLLAFNKGECPPGSQVGIAVVTAFIFNQSYAPIYNMEPKPGQAGLLSFFLNDSGTQQYVEISARTDSDYGLDTISNTIYHLFPVRQLKIELWGVPADPVHDGFRFKPPVTKDCSLRRSCSNEVVGIGAGVAPEPFLSNPTTCGAEDLEASVDVEFYDRTKDRASSPWPATTGCAQLAFNPSLTVKPTTGEADSASGLDADLRVPQFSSPTTPSPSEIRGATVTLPPGVSINPNAADGKTVCPDAQTGIGTRGPSTCPEFSKVGTVSIDSSALPGPIPGAIYLGEPKPGDRYRLVLAANGFGTHVKLTGSAKPDPNTGQIVVSFEDLPQSPLTDFNMHFFGSERGLLATPTHCGTYPVVSEFEPWDNVLENQSSTSFFDVSTGPGGSPCPHGARPFSPRFVAGNANPTAGRHTPFRLELARNDGEQNLAAFSVATPPGFSATLKGIPYCPESALAALAAGGVSGLSELAHPSCPAASQVGTAMVGAGAGNHPLYTPGRVYLAGPYRGAPLSLVTVVPAVSGPYDLGNVAVRAAVYVSRSNARVTAVTDALPQILDGIPLRVRSIRVELDRPNFTLNPTNCEPLATEASVRGTEGASVATASPFQAGNCAILPFRPNLRIRLSGGVNRRGHPALEATLWAKPGEANMKRVSVALPKGELLDNAHIKSPCTRVQFAAQACPPGSVLGSAEAITPLLDQPLAGNVYLRSNPAHKLPDIVADLRGQIDIELVGKIDTVHGGSLRTTFEGVPDAPVTKFTMRLAGGKRGLLQNERGLCGKREPAVVRMVGQNNGRVRLRKRLRVACHSKKRSKRHSRHARVARHTGQAHKAVR